MTFDLEARVLELVRQHTGEMLNRLTELEQLCNGDDLPDDEAAPELEIEHIVIPMVRAVGFFDGGDRAFTAQQLAQLRKLKTALNRPGAFIVDASDLQHNEGYSRSLIVAYYKLTDSSVRPINDVQMREADIEDATARLMREGALREGAS